MKNAKMTWKNARQPGIPHSDYWSTREQRRYLEREERRRTRKEAQMEAKREAQNTWSINVGLLIILAFLMYKGLKGDPWATAAVALYAIWRSFRKNESEE